MIREERLRLIVEHVERNNFASYEDLMERLEVSKATVRRDLELLGKAQRLTVVRGGAVARGSSVKSELPYEPKRRFMLAEKRRIAQAAAALVGREATILLDSGTTVREMVPHLVGKSGLHVITGDIAIASDFTYHPGVQVTVLGGDLRSGHYSLSGHLADSVLDDLHVDLCFCAVDAVTARGDCMINELSQEVSFKKKLRRAGERAVLLADHGKFGTQAMVRVYGVEDVDLIITGEGLSPALREGLALPEGKLELV